MVNQTLGRGLRSEDSGEEVVQVEERDGLRSGAVWKWWPRGKPRGLERDEEEELNRVHA